MNIMKFRIILTTIASIMLLSSCYEEQHFELPNGTGDQVIIPDTLPFPFDTVGMPGIYAVKDGVPDFTRISFRGYSDYQPVEEANSWGYNPDRKAYEVVQHNNFNPVDSEDYYGNNAGSYSSLRFTTKPMVQYKDGSQWYFRAKMTFPYVGGTAPWLWFGNTWGKRHLFGFDGANGFGGFAGFYTQINSQLINDPEWPSFSELVVPGVPFIIEFVCVDYLVYAKINGVVLWVYNIPKEEMANSVQFAPWRNGADIIDIYFDGDVEENYDHIAHANEGGYVTTQRPSLSKKSSGEVYMFAEGRVNNLELYPASKFTEDLIQPAHRHNATDIVVRSSSDNGGMWSDLSLVVGGDGSVNINPSSVATSDDKLHMIFTKDKSELLDPTTFDIYYVNGDGATWSAPAMVTVADLQGYTVRTTSGHGVALTDGSIAFPILATKGEGDAKISTAGVLKRSAMGVWAISYVGSDVTADKEIATGATLNMKADGSLALVMANEGSGSNYRISYSSDAGATWSVADYTEVQKGGTSGSRKQGTTVVRGAEMIHVGPNAVRSSYGGDAFAASGAPIYGQGLGYSSSIDGETVWSSNVSMVDFQRTADIYVLVNYMDAIELNDGRVLVAAESGVRFPSKSIMKYYIQ